MTTTTHPIDTIIAKWKSSFAGRTRYEGQEPREDEMLVAEVERLQRENASLNIDLNNASAKILRLQEINNAPREKVADNAATIDETMRFTRKAPPMTNPTQLRIRIAEAQGWTHCEIRNGTPRGFCPDSQAMEYIPDYQPKEQRDG